MCPVAREGAAPRVRAGCVAAGVGWRIVETCVGVWVVIFLRSGSGVCLCGGVVVGSLLVLRRLASLRSLVSEAFELPVV